YLDLARKHAAQQDLQRIDRAARVTTQVEDNGRTLARPVNHAVHFRLIESENGEFQDPQVVTYFRPTRPRKVLLGFGLAHHVPDVLAGHVADALELLELRHNLDLALLPLHITKTKPQPGFGPQFVVPVLHFPQGSPVGLVTI